MLFVSGTRDSLAGSQPSRKRRDASRGSDAFHWIETADHGYHPFKASGRTTADVLAEVATVATDWVGVLPR